MNHLITSTILAISCIILIGCSKTETPEIMEKINAQNIEQKQTIQICEIDIKTDIAKINNQLEKQAKTLNQINKALAPMLAALREAKIETTEGFLNSIAIGLMRYEDEYGYFPKFLLEEDRINSNTSNNTEKLVMALTGKAPDGRPLSQEERRHINRKAREFMIFHKSCLKIMDGEWKLIDPLGNPNIYICIQKDKESLLRKGLPNANDGISQYEASKFKDGIKAKVLVFTLKKDAANSTDEAEDIFIWK